MKVYEEVAGTKLPIRGGSSSGGEREKNGGDYGDRRGDPAEKYQKECDSPTGRERGKQLESMKIIGEIWPRRRSGGRKNSGGRRGLESKKILRVQKSNPKRKEKSPTQ